MKKFVSILLPLAFFMASSAIAGEAQPLIKSFRVVVWDNSSIGKIDSEAGTILVKHIPDVQDVTGVLYSLEDGASISPDPYSLVGNWPEDLVLSVSKGSVTQQYKVVFADLVKEKSPEGWELIWNDEFNDGAIDYDVWSKSLHPKMWRGQMTEDESMYEFMDGKLVLWGKDNPDTTVQKTSYLNAGLWSKDKKSFSLGRCDICAKYDCAKGFWPALWFLPQGHDQEQFSGSGEIDLVEHLNFDNYTYMTVHTRYTNLINKENPKNHVMVPIDVNAFNIYSVEVYNDKLVFLVNNQVAYEYPRITPAPTEANQFPFNVRDYYVLLSNQLGGKWVGEVDLQGRPVALYVDYVRVYQTK